jgi:hypothetical protein
LGGGCGPLTSIPTIRRGSTIGAAPAGWAGTSTSRCAGQLTAELQHYSYDDLADHLNRINHYTTLAATQMHEANRRATIADLLLHPPAAFLRNYILRRGFMDGGVGLILSAVNAWSVFLKFAKLWELERNPKAQGPKPNTKSQAAG